MGDGLRDALDPKENEFQGKINVHDRPEIRGTFGVVTSTHWLASASGMAMLEKGGNAFDACIAAAFVLQIVEPHLVGPAGDMPAVFLQSKARKVEVLCAQGVSPQAATIKAYRDLGSISCRAPAAGNRRARAFDGWMILLRDHGRLSLRRCWPRPSAMRATATRCCRAWRTRLPAKRPFRQ